VLELFGFQSLDGAGFDFAAVHGAGHGERFEPALDELLSVFIVEAGGGEPLPGLRNVSSQRWYPAIAATPSTSWL
jgi:hypothetical protein